MSNLEDLAKASTATESLRELFEALRDVRDRGKRQRKIPVGARRAKNRKVEAAAKQARRLNRTNKRGRSLAPRGR